MHKAGGIVSIIAGVLGICAAAFTLLFGGVASAFNAEGANTVVGLGWSGLLASFLVIVFGAVAFAKPKGGGIGLIICSITGMIGGGTFVAICLLLSLIGGTLCVIAAKSMPSLRTFPAFEGTTSAAPPSFEAAPRPWNAGRVALYGLFSFFAPLIGVIAGVIGLSQAHTRKQGALLFGLALAGTTMYAAISQGMKSEGGIPEVSKQGADAVQLTDSTPKSAVTAPVSDWPPVDVVTLVGKGASHILTDPSERSRYSQLVGSNTELDEYLTITVFDDQVASKILDQGEYLVIFSNGIVQRDTGPMDGAYAVNKTSGKPTAILSKGGEFTLLGATPKSLPSPLRKWAAENGALF